MTELNHLDNNKKPHGQEKILLALLPFWDPQIPPLGLACIKSYLQKHSFKVKAVDANLEIQFREIHDSYFQTLREMVPAHKLGNLYNIGNQVMRNHLVAHLNYTDEAQYRQLVNILVNNTFFTEIGPGGIEKLIQIITEFYSRLKSYILELLDKEEPSVLGLSVYGDTFGPSLAAFQWARQKNPRLKTVMGGGIFADQLAPGNPDLDYFVEKTKDIIDMIVIGEGEEILLRFIKGELESSQKIYGLKDLQGRYVDISKVEIPDFSDFDIQYYPHLAHYGARSCPFQCKFCSETVNWGKYRKKDVEQTVKEFIQLYRRHWYQLFLMTDSTLNPIITPLAEEFIKAGVAIYWDGFLRADKHVCNMENTVLWRRGGFYRAKLGLESGSQRVLDLMDKRITKEQSQTALASLAYAGIKTTTFWLFGFPGETEEDFQETLDFVAANKDNIYEADCNAFNYYLTGQANSEEWQKNNRGVLLYPEYARELLITQTWTLDCQPTRQEAYERVNRFVRHCKQLGIPNPYTLEDVNRADRRWKNLHKNAVPAVVEFKNKEAYIDESRTIKKLSFAHNTQLDDEEWL